MVIPCFTSKWTQSITAIFKILQLQNARPRSFWKMGFSPHSLEPQGTTTLVPVDFIPFHLKNISLCNFLPFLGTTCQNGSALFNFSSKSIINTSHQH